MFDHNITRLLNFLETKGNHFNVIRNVCLYNLVTMYSVDDGVKELLLDVGNQGEHAYA